MTLLYSTSLYITLPWLYFIKLVFILYCIQPQLYFTLHDLNITPPWLYFTLLESAFLYHGSTSLYFTLHHSAMALLYMVLHNSTMALLHSTSLYVTLSRLHFTLLDSTLLYHSSTSQYFTQITPPWIYLTLRDSTHNSTMAPLQAISVCIILTWIYFTLLDSTLLYHGST